MASTAPPTKRQQNISIKRKFVIFPSFCLCIVRMKYHMAAFYGIRVSSLFRYSISFFLQSAHIVMFVHVMVV